MGANKFKALSKLQPAEALVINGKSYIFLGWLTIQFGATPMHVMNFCGWCGTKRTFCAITQNLRNEWIIKKGGTYYFAADLGGIIAAGWPLVGGCCNPS